MNTEKLQRANELSIRLKHLKNFLQTVEELKLSERPIYINLEISSNTVSFALGQTGIPKECTEEILTIVEKTYKKLEIEFENM